MILDKHSLAGFSEWLGSASVDGGFALIDKDKDWTSFDVVAKLRGLTRIKKVGHAGTLDPLATGLLIVCFGKFTKKISEFQEQRKRYYATVKLGATTKTDDAEGEEENICSTEGISEEMILAALDNFRGEISQVPPIYSAIKKDGKPLYKLARKNIEVEIAPRQVTVYSISVAKIAMPFVELDIECSKGTYIRSLARDLGASLGCGGYLAGLRRTAIGGYSVEDAVRIADIIPAAKPPAQTSEHNFHETSPDEGLPLL